MILDLEARHYKRQGAKESDIRAQLALTPTHYYQQLNRLLDDEAAVAYRPMLVKQLRGRRVSRGQGRRQVA